MFGCEISSNASFASLAAAGLAKVIEVVSNATVMVAVLEVVLPAAVLVFATLVTLLKRALIVFFPHFSRRVMIDARRRPTFAVWWKVRHDVQLIDVSTCLIRSQDRCAEP